MNKQTEDSILECHVGKSRRIVEAARSCDKNLVRPEYSGGRHQSIDEEVWTTQENVDLIFIFKKDHLISIKKYIIFEQINFY